MTFDLADYPPDWKDFSRRIRFVRAGNRCECTGECGLHGAGLFHPAARRCVEMNGTKAKWAKSRVVLSVAHLNAKGGPCQCEPKCSIAAHVKAMCARCREGPVRHRQAAFKVIRRGIVKCIIAEESDHVIGGLRMKELLRWFRRPLTKYGPVCCFGTTLTWYGWGFDIQWRGGWIVYTSNAWKWGGWRMYWSPDGTPNHKRARPIWIRRG